MVTSCDTRGKEWFWKRDAVHITLNKYHPTEFMFLLST